MSNKPPLYVRGMHGVGDNLHQRAVLRLLKQNHSVTLESSWYSLYHDLIDEDFRVVGRGVNLRTQQKNAMRERHLFAPQPPHHHITSAIRLSYSTNTINQTDSKTITEALFNLAGLRGRFREADFRLPMRPEWLAEADRIMASWDTRGKPIMIYRPLVVRPEWMGSKVRNARPDQYRAIVSHLHQKFFCVSVADLEPGKEWLDGDEIPADLKFHGGEFVIEHLAALMHRADLVLTSGGMAAMLGPAVETPTISVLGGYEPPEWCLDSGKFSPFLCIAPNPPCACGSSGCMKNCSKLIDVTAARSNIDNFTSMIGDGPMIRINTDQPVAPPEPKGPALSLPTVSLLCVETQMHEMARRMIEQVTSKVGFAEVVIHTDKPDLIAIPGARYVPVTDWPEKIQCGSYCYNQAPASVQTPHMIFCEWDCAIREIGMWDPAFLDYDYIGAPWPGRRAGQWTPQSGCSVGNGGFTLWSAKLMQCVAANPQYKIGTDTHISIDHRRALEAKSGAKWPDEATAFRFSYEHGTDTERHRPSFGVHDVFNWPLALTKEDIIERAKILIANPYVGASTSKLHSLQHRAPYLAAEVPGYAEALARRPMSGRANRDHRPLNPLPHHAPQPQIPPRPPRVIVPGQGTISREEYLRALQNRGLKA